MEDALALCQRALSVLNPSFEQLTVRLAKNDSDWRRQLDDYANVRGFKGAKDEYETIAHQASLLTLLIVIDDEGHNQKARQELIDLGISTAYTRLTGSKRDLFTVPVLSELIATNGAKANIDSAPIYQLMGRQPLVDVIGGIYERVVPQAERRQFGQFWTPVPIAEFLAAWSIQPETASVYDPASGSGALVFAAAQRLLQLGRSPQQIREMMRGNEIDGLVRALMVTTLDIALPGDFSHFKLEDPLTDDSKITHSAIIANPPYTRHHHLSKEYKQRVKEYNQQYLGFAPGGFASLFVYFFTHSMSLLESTGRMAYITPAELYDAAYSKPLKKYLLERSNLRHLLVFGDDFAAFPGVDTAGVISLLEGGRSDGGQISIVYLNRWPGTTSLLKALESKAKTYSWGYVEKRSRKALAASAKWIVPREHRIKKQSDTVALGSLSRVMRGIATGNNSYFTLTDEEVKSTQIERKYLKPMVSKTRDCTSLNLNNEVHDSMRAAGKKAWLFYCAEDFEELKDTNAARYIERGIVEKVDQGVLVSTRSPWFNMEKRNPPAIIYTYLSRGWPRFIRNDAKLLNLNGFHSVYPIPEICEDSELLDSFCAILNSQRVLAGLREIGRSYGGGTIKIEPRELDQLSVLDPRSLPSAKRKKLAKLFNKYSELDPDNFAKVRLQIDNLL